MCTAVNCTVETWQVRLFGTGKAEFPVYRIRIVYPWPTTLWPVSVGEPPVKFKLTYDYVDHKFTVMQIGYR